MHQARPSRRPVSRDLLDLLPEHILRRFQIVTRLDVYPERAASLEELAEPQRGVGRHGLFLARDAFDAGARNYGGIRITVTVH